MRPRATRKPPTTITKSVNEIPDTYRNDTKTLHYLDSKGSVSGLSGFFKSNGADESHIAATLSNDFRNARKLFT